VRLPDRVQRRFPRVVPGIRDFHCKVRPEKLEFGAGIVLLTAKEIESGFDRSVQDHIQDQIRSTTKSCSHQQIVH